VSVEKLQPPASATFLNPRCRWLGWRRRRRRHREGIRPSAGDCMDL